MTTALASPTEDLRSLRRENRLREERIKAAQLERQEKLQERHRVRETWQTDWVRPYLDLFTQSRFDHGGYGGPATIWQRRQGRNYPLFQTEQELALLRFPSRWLCSTNNYAIGFTEGLAGYILGTGITYRATIKAGVDIEDGDPLTSAVQQVIDNFLEANEWYGGELPGFEDEYFKRTIEDGEAVALHFPLSNGMVQLRFAEPEQLTQPPGSDFDEWGFGIRTSKLDMQNPLGYYIAWSANIAEGDELPADRVTHFRRNVKRGVKRGVPEFSFDTFDSLDEASKLCNNMGEAAAQQARLVAVMEFDTGTKSEIEAVRTGLEDFSVPDPWGGNPTGVRKGRKGETEYIPSSQRYTTGPAATNAEAHSAVLQMLLRSACVRWNMPEWFGSADSSQTNRANGITAERNGVNRIQREQKRYCSAFRRIVWYAVEHWCRTHGEIAGMDLATLKATIDIQATAPEPVSDDPLAKAQIAAIEIPMGLDSRQNYMQDVGRNAKQIEADNEEWEAEHGPSPEELAAALGNDPNDPNAENDPGNEEEDDLSPLQETVDEGGHKHDDDGKFSSVSGHARGKKKVTSRVKSGKKASGKTTKPKTDSADSETPKHAEDYANNGTKAKAFKAWFGDWESDPQNASKVVNDKGEPQETYTAKKVYHGTTHEFNAFDPERLGESTKHPTAKLGYFFTESPEVARQFSGERLEIRKGKTENQLSQEMHGVGYFSMDPQSPERKAVNAAYTAQPDVQDWTPSPHEGAKVMEAYLNIRNPYEMSMDEWAEKFTTPMWKKGQGAEVSIANVAETKKKLLEQGYDGIRLEKSSTPTKKYGEYGAVTWIAFEPNQVKSTKNRGTFDPNSAKLSESQVR